MFCLSSEEALAFIMEVINFVTIFGLTPLIPVVITELKVHIQCFLPEKFLSGPVKKELLKEGNFL
jgi:hypothetical protein